jgi:hypothetical protein
MADSIKVIGAELILSSTVPNTVTNATLVRIVNTADSPNDVLISLYYANGVSKGSFTLGHDGTGFSTLNLVKLPTDTILASTANATVVTRAVSIAYS